MEDLNKNTKGDSSPSQPSQKESQNFDAAVKTKETPVCEAREAELKLPHMFEAIVRDADSPVDKSSVEKLYDQLYSGVFLNQTRKKYWVAKNSGSNGFTLFARDLVITWAEDNRYWKWITSDEFADTVELVQVCWLEIHARLDTAKLSPGISYEVVFVIMLKDPARWKNPVNLKLLFPDGTKQEHRENFMIKPKNEWIVIPVGEFKTSPEIAGDMDIAMYECDSGKWKSGLVVKGVIIWPKNHDHNRDPGIRSEDKTKEKNKDDIRNLGIWTKDKVKKNDDTNKMPGTRSTDIAQESADINENKDDKQNLGIRSKDKAEETINTNENQDDNRDPRFRSKDKTEETMNKNEYMDDQRKPETWSKKKAKENVDTNEKKMMGTRSTDVAQQRVDTNENKDDNQDPRIRSKDKAKETVTTTENKMRVPELKLPHMFEAIVKDADSPVDMSSAEKLYDQLYSGVFINQKRKMFWVEKKSGSNCFALFARDLVINWAEDNHYWKWIKSDEFVDAAELVQVCSLEIHARLDAAKLSPGISYEVVFVITLKNPERWKDPVNLKLLFPDGTKQEHGENFMIKPRNEWIVMPVGEFKTSPELAGDIDISMSECDSGTWKSGLVVRGVLIWPKNDDDNRDPGIRSKDKTKEKNKDDNRILGIWSKDKAKNEKDTNKEAPGTTNADIVQESIDINENKDDKRNLGIRNKDEAEETVYINEKKDDKRKPETWSNQAKENVYTNENKMPGTRSTDIAQENQHTNQNKDDNRNLEIRNKDKAEETINTIENKTTFYKLNARPGRQRLLRKEKIWPGFEVLGDGCHGSLLPENEIKDKTRPRRQRLQREETIEDKMEPIDSITLNILSEGSEVIDYHVHGSVLPDTEIKLNEIQDDISNPESNSEDEANETVNDEKETSSVSKTEGFKVSNDVVPEIKSEKTSSYSPQFRPRRQKLQRKEMLMAISSYNQKPRTRRQRLQRK